MCLSKRILKGFHNKIFLTVDTCDRSLIITECYGNEISVSIGSSVTFECTCLNDTAQWELNGVDISNNTHYIINATSGTLTIPAVKSSDNGTYTCNSSSVSLTVTGKYNYATLQLIRTSTFSSYYYSFWSIY